MLDPRAIEFLDVRFKRLRYWYWRHVRRRRYALIGHPRRYRDHISMLKKQRWIHECPHTDTRPNPDATYVADRNPRICNRCGVGMITWKVDRSKS